MWNIILRQTEDVPSIKTRVIDMFFAGFNTPVAGKWPKKGTILFVFPENLAKNLPEFL